MKSNLILSLSVLSVATLNVFLRYLDSNLNALSIKGFRTSGSVRLHGLVDSVKNVENKAWHGGGMNTSRKGCVCISYVCPVGNLKAEVLVNDPITRSIPIRTQEKPWNSDWS